MHILLTTDAFPPVCGGSGWSTYELARGLRAMGHRVSIVRARPGEPAGVRLANYDDFVIHEIGAYAPRVPYLRNYFKNERFSRQFAAWLRGFMREQQVDVVHAQHVLSAPGSILAAARHAVGDTGGARDTRVPIVCTVRDYWPVCYWTTLIYDYHAPTLCPACSPAMMTRCVRPRAGALWPATLPLIPYMMRNLRWKRELLSRADAVIAVSSTIARDLRARAPELTSAPTSPTPRSTTSTPAMPTPAATMASTPTRIDIIPNPVDIRAIRAAAGQTAPPADVPRPYAIYIGKLAQNKGIDELIPAITRAALRWPLVVVGDGPDRAAVAAAARASGRDVRFTGWLARDEALRWLAHASVLIFPSYGPESLSRVLLEASALGVPTAAMDTGGTGDIITHDQTGLLSPSGDANALGDHIARLVADEALRARLSAAARAHVDAHFDSRVVISRIIALYEDLRATQTPTTSRPPSPEATRAHA